MKTNCNSILKSFSLWGLFISCLLLGSSCSDITTGEALGAVLSGGINVETEVCEVDFTSPAVKWQLDFNDKMIAGGEAQGVIVVFKWTNQPGVTVLGIDKNNGMQRWSQVITDMNTTPRTYFANNEVLIYAKHSAVRMDLTSGNIIDEIKFSLFAKRMIFHNEDYYLITDPCDANNAFGLYQYKAMDREHFNLIYEFSDWPHAGTFLDFFDIARNSQNQPLLIFSASFPWDGEAECVVNAFDLNDQRIAWTITTKSDAHFFGSKNNVHIFEDQLLIARRRVLTLYSVDDGALIWETANYEPAGFYNSKILLHDGRIYVQDNYQSQNICFDYASGNELWRYTTGIEATAYFTDDQLIWGGSEASQTMAFLNKGTGLIVKTMEQPWSTCPYAWFEFLDNTSTSADVIVAYDAKKVIGLAY